ncbi:MAG: DUF1211 domain-containing protein [Pyrinomonadaceae bacterium]|nr:DUF1211 domain-containing protein [Pyrinomonadaceae bacterium]
MSQNQKLEATLSTQRLEAFSDSVFAIVITLLFLDLKTPEMDIQSDWRELLDALYKLSPKFISIIVSFAFVAIFWVAHHQFFRTLQKTTRGLLWLNLVFLFLVCFVPFPAAIMTEYPENKTAVAFFGATILLTSGMLCAVRWYTWIKHSEISAATSESEVKQALNRSLLMVALYAVALAISFFFPVAAIVLYLLILLILLFPVKVEIEEETGDDEENPTTEVIL